MMGSDVRNRLHEEIRCVCGHWHSGELDCPAWECPCQMERDTRYWFPVIQPGFGP